MATTSLSRPLTLLFTLFAFASAASTPVATSPILTTITTTNTRFSTRTVSTSTSTTTPVLCDDGTCIAISLVEIPILSTSTILSVGTVVSTVGFTTLYSEVPDAASTTPNSTPANPTTTPTTAQPTTTPTTSALSSIFTTTQTTGTASGQASVVTVYRSATGTSDASQSGNNNSGGGGGGTSKTVYIVVAVLAVIVGLALASGFGWFFVRRRRNQKAMAAAPLGSFSGEDSATGSGIAELETKEEKRKAAELATTTGDGYRGTLGTGTPGLVPWRPGAPPPANVSELPGGYGARPGAYEMEGTMPATVARYELR